MTKETGNPEALRAHKADSQKATRLELELAVRRIVNGNPQRVKKGTSLSPLAVAAEADVNRTTLYRYHEPVLTEIRRINDSTPQKKLREKQSELAEIEAKAKEYRLMLEDEQANLAKMARQNYILSMRIKELEGIVQNRDTLIAELRSSNQRVVAFPTKKRDQ